MSIRRWFSYAALLGGLLLIVQLAYWHHAEERMVRLVRRVELATHEADVLQLLQGKKYRCLDGPTSATRGLIYCVRTGFLREVILEVWFHNDGKVICAGATDVD